MTHSLAIPDLPEGVTSLAAALAYAEYGWYVGPVEPDTKHPGSRLGKGWQRRTTYDPEVIRRRWLNRPDDGVFLHAGRSGAVIFDVDHPDRVPEVLREAVLAAEPPFQSTRINVPGKGHYVFRQPPGRSFGNSTGGLGIGWGEVRGTNGVIVVEPSVHPDAAEGGRYRWEFVGAVPQVPASVAVELADAKTAGSPANAAEMAEFFAAHNTGNPRRLKGILAKLDREIAAGCSRHVAAQAALVWAMKEARAGVFPAEIAYREISARFHDAFEGNAR